MDPVGIEPKTPDRRAPGASRSLLVVRRYFLEWRELGALNIGGPGTIVVDDKPLHLSNLDCHYVGQRNRKLEFASADAAHPAIFYLLSYPANGRSAPSQI